MHDSVLEKKVTVMIFIYFLNISRNKQEYRVGGMIFVYQIQVHELKRIFTLSG